MIKSQLSSTSITESFIPGGEKIQRISYEIDGSLDWLLTLSCSPWSVLLKVS